MKSQGRLMGCKAGVAMEEQQAWARASDRREALGATNRPPKSWENDDPPPLGMLELQGVGQTVARRGVSRSYHLLTEKLLEPGKDEP